MVRMISCWMGAIALFIASGTLPARSASFDCAKARASDEIAICNNPTLSALDSEMGGLWYAYSKFPFLMGESGARQDEAQAFLQKRSSCGGDVGCLRQVYEDRIKQLKQDIANATAQETNATGGPAPTDPATSLPGPVDDIINAYGPQCSKYGGKLTNPGAVEVMASDLDGDARMDYLLNPEVLDCNGAATAFCGNGGCQISIALSGDDYRKPLDVMGGEPTLTQRGGNTSVEIWVDRTNCPGAGRSVACWAVYSWADGSLKTRHETRPNID